MNVSLLKETMLINEVDVCLKIVLLVTLQTYWVMCYAKSQKVFLRFESKTYNLQVRLRSFYPQGMSYFNWTKSFSFCMFTSKLNKNFISKIGKS